MNAFISQFGRVALVAVPLLAWPGAGRAEPFVPKSDQEILERLRVTRFDPAARELRQLRSVVALDLFNLTNALLVGRRYVELSRSSGGPRYGGHGESILEPWLTGHQPSAAALVLRATVKPSQHEFGNALHD